MHIPDGFLDPKVSAGMAGMAAAALAYCFAKVRAALTAVVPAQAFAVAGKRMASISGKAKRVLTSFGEKQIYKMGMAASLIFAAQMFNFPVPGGTSGHLIGGVFAAVILGPFAGAVVLSTVLFVQMIFFADGGLFSLGANIINMAVIGSFLCYYIYYFAKKVIPEWGSIMIAAWTSVVLAALACALQIGLSGTVPLQSILPPMLKAHAVIGIAEVAFTLILIKIFRKLAPAEK